MKTVALPLVGALLGTMLAFSVPSLFRAATETIHPPEEWLEISELRVEDAVVGEEPVTTLIQTVHQQSLGQIHATLWRMKPDGQFVEACGGFSRHQFVPEHGLPERLTIHYWTATPPNPPCLPTKPGVWKMSLWFDVQGADGRLSGSIPISSNEFTVRSAS